MKRIKLVFYINVILLIHFNCKAQSIIDGTRYLVRSTWAGRYNIDSTQLIGNTNDSLVFQITSPPYGKERKKRTFVKKNNIVSVVDADKMRPLYNYNLQEKDSFIASWAWGGDTNKIFSTTLYVDSIRNVKLLDNKLYKHWYFKRNTTPGYPIIWIENLGDAQLGWDYREAFAFEVVYYLNAVCQNNNLILNNTPQLFNSCNFDSLKITDISSISTIEKIKIFPNPANEKLFIESNVEKNSNYIITNLLGQEMDKGLLKSEINISNLLNGVYFIEIVNANNQTQALKFVKQ